MSVTQNIPKMLKLIATASLLKADQLVYELKG